MTMTNTKSVVTIEDNNLSQALRYVTEWQRKFSIDNQGRKATGHDVAVHTGKVVSSSSSSSSSSSTSIVPDLNLRKAYEIIARSKDKLVPKSQETRSTSSVSLPSSTTATTTPVLLPLSSSSSSSTTRPAVSSSTTVPKPLSTIHLFDARQAFSSSAPSYGMYSDDDDDDAKEQQEDNDEDDNGNRGRYGTTKTTVGVSQNSLFHGHSKPQHDKNNNDRRSSKETVSFTTGKKISDTFGNITTITLPIKSSSMTTLSSSSSSSSSSSHAHPESTIPRSFPLPSPDYTSYLSSSSTSIPATTVTTYTNSATSVPSTTGSTKKIETSTNFVTMDLKHKRKIRTLRKTRKTSSSAKHKNGLEKDLQYMDELSSKYERYHGTDKDTEGNATDDDDDDEKEDTSEHNSRTDPMDEDEEDSGNDGNESTFTHSHAKKASSALSVMMTPEELANEITKEIRKETVTNARMFIPLGVSSSANTTNINPSYSSNQTTNGKKSFYRKYSSNYISAATKNAWIIAGAPDIGGQTNTQQQGGGDLDTLDICIDSLMQENGTTGTDGTLVASTTTVDGIQETTTLPSSSTTLPITAVPSSSTDSSSSSSSSTLSSIPSPISSSSLPATAQRKTKPVPSYTDIPRGAHNRPLCTGHQLECKLRKVKKEGVNKGKYFYACPANQEASCGFFLWKDHDAMAAVTRFLEISKKLAMYDAFQQQQQQSMTHNVPDSVHPSTLPVLIKQRLETEDRLREASLRRWSDKAYSLIDLRKELNQRGYVGRIPRQLLIVSNADALMTESSRKANTKEERKRTIEMVRPVVVPQLNVPSQKNTTGTVEIGDTVSLSSSSSNNSSSSSSDTSSSEFDTSVTSSSSSSGSDNDHSDTIDSSSSSSSSSSDTDTRSTMSNDSSAETATVSSNEGFRRKRKTSKVRTTTRKTTEKKNKDIRQKRTAGSDTAKVKDKNKTDTVLVSSLRRNQCVALLVYDDIRLWRQTEKEHQHQKEYTLRRSKNGKSSSTETLPTAQRSTKNAGLNDTEHDGMDDAMWIPTLSSSSSSPSSPSIVSLFAYRGPDPIGYILSNTLQRIFGYTAFRGETRYIHTPNLSFTDPTNSNKDTNRLSSLPMTVQEWACRRSLVGLSSLVVAATGTGKSLCYQLPALILATSVYAPSPGTTTFSSSSLSLPDPASSSSSPPHHHQYEIPSGVTIVISPLIALMKDQILHLPRGLRAVCLSGKQHQNANDIADALIALRDRTAHMLYVSPERLFSRSFLRLVRTPGMLPNIALVAIDEAHVISEWSHNFRPAYLRLHMIIDTILRPRAVIALTATATPSVIQAIQRSLRIPTEGTWITNWRRNNFRYSASWTGTPEERKNDEDEEVNENEGTVSNVRTKNHRSVTPLQTDPERLQALVHLLKAVAKYGLPFRRSETSSNHDGGEDDSDNNGSNDNDTLVSVSRQRKKAKVTTTNGNRHNGKTKDSKGNANDNDDEDDNDSLTNFNVKLEGITLPSVVIYVSTQNEADTIATYLTSHGITAGSYHAGLSLMQRNRIHNRFLAGTLPIVVATIAFGMGLDKSNIRLIIHYGIPRSIEDYVQQCGRAGRDNGLAWCHTLLDSSGNDYRRLHSLCYTDELDWRQITGLLNFITLTVVRYLRVRQVFLEHTAFLGGNADTVTNGNTKRVYPVLNYIECTLSIAALIAKLNIRSEVIETLLCYLEHLNLVDILSPRYTHGDIIIVKNTNNVVTNDPIIKMAIALAKVRKKTTVTMKTTPSTAAAGRTGNHSTGSEEITISNPLYPQDSILRFLYPSGLIGQSQSVAQHNTATGTNNYTNNKQLHQAAVVKENAVYFSLGKDSSSNGSTTIPTTGAESSSSSSIPEWIGRNDRGQPVIRVCFDDLALALRIRDEHHNNNNNDHSLPGSSSSSSSSVTSLWTVGLVQKYLYNLQNQNYINLLYRDWGFTIGIDKEISTFFTIGERLNGILPYPIERTKELLTKEGSNEISSTTTGTSPVPSFVSNVPDYTNTVHMGLVPELFPTLINIVNRTKQLTQLSIHRISLVYELLSALAHGTVKQTLKTFTYEKNEGIERSRVLSIPNTMTKEDTTIITTKSSAVDPPPPNGTTTAKVYHQHACEDTLLRIIDTYLTQDDKEKGNDKNLSVPLTLSKKSHRYVSLPLLTLPEPLRVHIAKDVTSVVHKMKVLLGMDNDHYHTTTGNGRWPVSSSSSGSNDKRNALFSVSSLSSSYFIQPEQWSWWDQGILDSGSSSSSSTSTASSSTPYRLPNPLINAYSVTRILHGITTPIFPATDWRTNGKYDSSLWGKYAGYYFTDILGIAELVIAGMARV